jgi:glucuronokinase
MRYETNIPRMVGLSGSSAIVVSAFRGLLRYYGLSIADLNIRIEELPQIILDIERRELDISAGLQDRVIQVYGGLVFMNFSEATPVYTSLDPSSLPCMYLAYNTNTGGDSGKVHSTVKERWLRQDEELVRGMQELGRFAAAARDALVESSNNAQATIASLMTQNFAMRRKLYGDEVVGAENISVAEIIQSYGLACKFTGSGGAFVCLRSDGGVGW